MQTKEQIMAHLNDLKNRHRLGMHVWEKRETKTAPNANLQEILDTPLKKIPALLRALKMPLLSMNLLPSDASGYSMATYFGAPNERPLPGYLFSLDTGHETSARTVFVSSKDLGTGGDYLNKKISPEAIRAAGIEGADQRSATMLDTLGKQMESGEVPPLNGTGHILLGNEIVVAANRHNLEAICLPVWIDPHLAADSPISTSYNAFVAALPALANLHCGLTGLDAVRRGFNVPVVKYNIAPPNQGKLIYIGQNRAEFLSCCLNAIRELDERNMWNKAPAYMKDILNLDPKKPLTEQLDILLPLIEEVTPKETIQGGGQIKKLAQHSLGIS